MLNLKATMQAKPILHTTTDPPEHEINITITGSEQECKKAWNKLGLIYKTHKKDTMQCQQTKKD